MVPPTISLSIYLIVLGTAGALHDLATNIRHSSRSSAFLTVSLSSKPVQSWMLSSDRFLSASPSPSPYSALEDCLGKSRSFCDMPISLHFASFYSAPEFFVGFNGLPNPVCTSLLVMWSLYEMPRRRLKLLVSTVCIFLSNSAVNVQVSQEYKNMDMTKERNSLIFELRSMFLSSQMILSFVSTAMVLANLERISGMDVSDYGSQIFEALKGFQLLAIDPDVTADAIGVVGHQFGHLSTYLHAVCGRSLVKALH